MADIIIENGYLLTMDPQRADIEKGRLVIDKGRISSVGEKRQEEAAKTIDASGCIVMPGLVNTHTHQAMTLFRGIADDIELQSWLENHIWPAEAELTEKDVYIGSLIGCIEMIRTGTTTFNDMYSFMEECARAVRESGLRASLCYGMIDFGNQDKADAELDKASRFIEDCRGQANERITAMFGPHAAYTCSSKFLRRIIEADADIDAGLHIHVSETQFERDQSIKKHGLSPVRYLNDLGVFDRHCVAAHCVWVDEEDQQILIDKKVHIAHNVLSNMKLASGIAPVASMLAKGASISLGTDGCASNNNLDMFEEMKTAAMLQKVSMKDASVLNAREVLKLATSNGAAALGIHSGMLKEGYKADIILVDMNRAGLNPIYDIPSHLVYCARGSDVKTTIVSGEILMENHQICTLDEQEILKELQSLSMGMTLLQ